ncbi:MAG: hypothetical protein DRI61_04940 [Chloroflexi bacterium]|nr:MAG: hypothetical protein DRI61_04940 [Chloroflexota bacterium]
MAMADTTEIIFGRWLRHRPKTFFLIFLLLAWGLRLYGITFQSFWRDEVDAVLFSLVPLNELLGYFTKPGWNGPLYYLLLRGWIELMGTGEFPVRFFSLLFGLLVVPLTYRIAARFLPSRGALLAMLLAASSPYLIWYSQEAKMYGLLMSLGALSLALHIEALEKGGWLRWAGYIGTLWVSLYIHLLSVFLFVGQVAFFAGFWPRYRERLRAEVTSWLIVAAPALPLLRWLVPDFFSARPTGFPYFPLPDMLSILLTGWSVGVLSSLWPWSTLPCIVALFSSLAVWRKSLPLWAFGLASIISLHLICLWKPVFTDRYVIYLAPAFYVLVSLGIINLKSPGGSKRAGGLRQLISTLLLLGILAADADSIWKQTHFPIKSDFRSAVAVFREHARQGDVVVFLIPYVKRVFDYYDPPPYRAVEAPYTNAGMSEREVDAYLHRHIGYRKRVWLVLSEEAMWDARRLVPRWLEEHYEPVLVGRFTRVALYLYQQPPVKVDLEALKYRCFLPLVLSSGPQ